MGQAKRNRQRLGEWYGKPVAEGHPDFVPPKKPMHPEATRTLSGTGEALQGHPENEGRPVRTAIGTHPKARRLPGLFALAVLGTIAASGIDLGPEPRPKKR